MKTDLHTYVVIEGDFRRIPDFDQPTGGDLAEVLAQGLPTQGITVRETEGVDFAHYIKCEVQTSGFQLTVSEETPWDPETNWSVMVCWSDRSAFSRIPTARLRQLLLAINEVLHECDRITDVRWYPWFDESEHLFLMHRADSPIIEADYWETLRPLIRAEHGIGNRGRRIAHSLLLVVLCTCAFLPTQLPLAAKIATGVMYATFGRVIFVPIWRDILIYREARRLREQRDRAESDGAGHL